MFTKRGMMNIRRVLTAIAAVASCTALSHPVVAQQNNPQNRREQERRSQADQRDIQALVQLVDAVAAVKQPAPADIPVTWAGNHFVRGAEGATFIPFTLAVDASKAAAPGTALYVRAVSKSAAAPAPEQNQQNRRGDQPQAPMYPWDDIQFFNLPSDGSVSRAMMLKPGEYDVFVALKERSPAEQQRNQPPAKMGLLRHTITVPDFTGPELAISTPIIATAVEPLTSPLSPEEQRANPYTFGGALRVVPSREMKFKTSGEFLMVFWVYGQPASGKPDVQIEYNFHHKTAEGEKYFNKAQPQVFNASTLPPNFDFAAGHQLMSIFGVPLKTFPAGDYRVEFTITDKLSGRKLTQNVTFTVES
ncbi:MAG: hypothetical protein HYY76_16580 [Acidobacteria bacterium]|nr:hypothetical protein [Acidobacteriota bacterium]